MITLPQWLLPVGLILALAQLLLALAVLRMVYFASTGISLFFDDSGHNRQRIRNTVLTIMALVPVEIGVRAYWMIFDVSSIHRFIAAVAFVGLLIYAFAAFALRSGPFMAEVAARAFGEVDVDRPVVVSPAEATRNVGSPYRVTPNNTPPSTNAGANATSTTIYDILKCAPLILALFGTGIYGITEWRPISPFLFASGVAIAVFDVARWHYRCRTPQMKLAWLGAAGAALLLGISAVPMINLTNRWSTGLVSLMIVSFGLFALFLVRAVRHLEAS